MHQPILIFTTPGCPDCMALKQWLHDKGYTYEERNLSQPGVADEAKLRYGVRIAPITVIGEAFFYGTFSAQRPRIETALAG